MKKLTALLTCLLFLFVCMSPVQAHSGRTDSSGGHHDYKNKSGLGSYHYHHGMGPHLHPGGVCPYATTVAPTQVTPSKVTTKVNKIYASVPGYQIKIRGVAVDSTYSKYPFLSYKNITYVPLAYGVCNALGITIKWDNATGLTLSKGTSSSSSITADYGVFNSPGQSKEITYPQFNIYLNGQWVNNGSLTYPFIIFNDVTYMPLTWDIAVQQLGLTMDWSAQTGLSIGNSARVSNTLNTNVNVGTGQL